jgi:hypothetical protein
MEHHFLNLLCSACRHPMVVNIQSFPIIIPVICVHCGCTGQYAIAMVKKFEDLRLSLMRAEFTSQP